MINIKELYENAILLRALYTCCELNIPDIIKQNKLSINKLSITVNTDSDAIERLMRLLISHRVFEQEDSGNYINTDFSLQLCNDHPESLRPLILHEDNTRWNALGNLSHSIKTGKPAFDKIYNQDYFTYLKSHKNLSDRFNQAMCCISEKEENIIAKKINFSGIIIDIGGGTGQLINKINHSNDIEHAYLLELPEVNENFTHKNCTKLSGSFFDSIPDIKADIYILKRILHDWPDKLALKILKNIAASMPQNSKLLIFEGVIMPNDKFLTSIDMLLLTIFGGKERSKEEFISLLDKAGFKINNVQNLAENMNVIECMKTQ